MVKDLFSSSSTVFRLSRRNLALVGTSPNNAYTLVVE